MFDFAGIDPALPLFAFVFLVALGIDYNIFLMARVREETLTHGTRDGTIRGLAVTGAVITSAGLVLAGTFSVLGILPLVFLTEIGFTIAVGVLIDTFLVRSLLVPALVLEHRRPRLVALGAGPDRGPQAPGASNRRARLRHRIVTMNSELNSHVVDAVVADRLREAERIRRSRVESA